MPQKRQPPESPTPPRLTCSRAEAQQRLEAQIGKGRDLVARPLGSEQELARASADETKWTQYNHELLLRIFDNSTMADEYARSYAIAIGGYSTFPERVHDLHRDIEDNITRLESIVGRLDLIPELVAARQAESHPHSGASSVRNVFVVHGHDEAAKEAVCRFLMTLRLQPIVLSEQPNAGKTIIEKLETSSEVGFAIILLTPDDVGAAKSDADNLKPRARQNVILELGYFVGKLGRERVCALYRSSVELPSDYHGVAYVSLDDNGAWKLSLAREIKAAGLDVDLNLAL